MPITLRDLMTRKACLEQLSMGLMTELANVRKGQDRMLRNERQEYLAGLRHAWSGVEKARVVVSRAVRRMRELGA